MTQIWLVRHGEAAASWEKDPDPGLSALGREQAERTALMLSGRKVWLQDFMRQRWSEQSDDLWSWRSDIILGLRDVMQPTVIFCHFLVINAVVAEITEKNDVLQIYPANASFHELALDGETLSLIQLGEQMETRVN
jgi:broad specificity phosphatase PhoE